MSAFIFKYFAQFPNQYRIDFQVTLNQKNNDEHKHDQKERINIPVKKFHSGRTITKMGEMLRREVKHTDTKSKYYTIVHIQILFKK